MIFGAIFDVIRTVRIRSNTQMMGNDIKNATEASSEKAGTVQGTAQAQDVNSMRKKSFNKS